MKKLGARGQRWLKSLHIYAACLWVGCGTTLTVLSFTVDADSGAELYGIRATIDFIDLFILVPGAIATFLTALVFSIWTGWGWFKHKWITVKWIICVFGLVFGTFWLGPWVTELAVISKQLGMAALSDPEYRRMENNVLIFGTFQVLTTIFALAISTLKPWRKRRPAPVGRSGPSH
jgi:hypothetical protein